jgi:hypothetical protein
MNFCATCGRRRTGDTRFCAGCGAEFAKDEAPPPAPAVPAPAVPAPAVPAAEAPATSLPADEEARWDPPAEAAGWESPAAPAGWAPADATRVERQPDATRVDTQDAVPVTPAAAEPDPFASWFAADPAEGKASPRTDPPGQSQQPGGRWQSADTVYAAPAQRPPASPPPQPPYGVQQAPSPGLPGGNPSSGGRKAAFIIGVLLVMIAAGGGAYALVSRSNQHNSAQPPAPTVTANSSAAASTNASASASGSPSTSPTTSASASASPSAGLVSLGPGVASNPAEPAVEKTLTNYFQGINTHNYAEYSSALDAQERAAEPQSKFDSGYSSTADSGMKLISLVGSGDGGLAATVTFTSHQAAGSGIDGSTCDNWKLTLYLVQQGASYLQGTAPSGYSPSYSDC